VRQSDGAPVQSNPIVEMTGFKIKK